MRVRRLFLLLSLLLLPGFLQAAPELTRGNLLRMNDRQPGLVHGGTVGSLNAKIDTLVVYGGPGVLEGKFQDGGGGVDMGGWTSEDVTFAGPSAWHVDNYLASTIGDGGPDNHAWWCGEMFPACGLDDLAGGYGNNWKQWLDWAGTVSDPEVATLVQLEFDISYDSEYGYDGTYIHYWVASGFQTLDYLDGAGTLLGRSHMFVMAPEDYQGDEGNEVRIRFEFLSDGGWSDEDCSWYGSGAVRLDDISVRFDGVLQGTVEDCEDSEVLQWVATEPPGVGDYAKVWPRLGALDPCHFNNTPVVAFIDDGQVVPGTGGTRCQTWCYGDYQGWVLNCTGGLMGEGYYLDNGVISPVIEWPDGDYDGARFDFDVFRHFDWGEAGSPGMMYNWQVRSTSDPTGDGGWDGWRDYGTGFTGGPGWFRGGGEISSLLVPERSLVQFRLEVFEIGWHWGYVGTDATPAPYYDNVCLKAWRHGGPTMSARQADLAQDGFPSGGALDYDDPVAASVRFDMARSVAPDEDVRNDPGDSLVITVRAVRPGAQLHGTPRMYYRIKENPHFDFDRSPEFSAAGYTEGRPSHLANSFYFDLPDTGWLFPGDIVHYYFEAQDNAGGDIGTTLMPADTTGFSHGWWWPEYETVFTMRCLPTIHDDEGDRWTPDILFWNDGGSSNEDEWIAAFNYLATVAGDHIDCYSTNSPSSMVGNGLGGRATSAQLAGYDLLIYASDYLGEGTITEASAQSGPGDDVGLLDAWLRQGGRTLLLTGDNLVSDMVNSSWATESFVAEWLGVDVGVDDLRPLIDGQTAPTVRIDAGNPVFSAVDEWITYASCPDFRTMDAVTLLDGAERLAHFLDPAGEDTYDVSAATLNHVAASNADVISLPYGFATIYSSQDPGFTGATRSRMLMEIMIFAGTIYGGSPAPVPSPVTESLEVHPNPFNPQTQVTWTLAQDCHAAVDILDLRGRVVRTLVDNEFVAAVDHRLWDGCSNNGTSAPSGVYFARIRTAHWSGTQKIALIR